MPRYSWELAQDKDTPKRHFGCKHTVWRVRQFILPCSCAVPVGLRAKTVLEQRWLILFTTTMKGSLSGSDLPTIGGAQHLIT